MLEHALGASLLSTRHRRCSVFFLIVDRPRQFCRSSRQPLLSGLFNTLFHCLQQALRFDFHFSLYDVVVNVVDQLSSNAVLFFSLLWFFFLTYSFFSFHSFPSLQNMHASISNDVCFISLFLLLLLFYFSFFSRSFFGSFLILSYVLDCYSLLMVSFPHFHD